MLSETPKRNLSSYHHSGDLHVPLLTQTYISFGNTPQIHMASIDELIAELSLNPERESVASELGGASCLSRRKP